MARHALTELPCSLDPLPDESLPGYVLRQSHRLELPPARIGALTGLAPDGRSGALPARLLAVIPTAAAREFSRTTRLTGGEVARLCLSSLDGRYPLSPGLVQNSAALRLTRSDRWLLVPATRYCPDCLAGDGSPVQQAFGGPWRKLWHLPVVFACPGHRRLLEDRCPECDQQVRGVLPGAPALLLPALRAHALHPSQCRSVVDSGRGRTLPTCCGFRLDRTPRRRPVAPELIALQHKILRLLTAGDPDPTSGTNEPTAPLHYFVDLRALSHLICASWPAARHLSPSGETAAAIDRHTASQHQQIAARLSTSPTARTQSVFDHPATDAAASAGLLGIADRILASGAPDEVREHLRDLLPANSRRASRTLWGLWVSRATPPCSDGLQAAYAPLLRGFTKIDGNPRARRDAAVHPRRWGAEHIPAFLPADWHERHFEPLAQVNPMFIRRTAVLRLVQMVAGGSLGEAAGFLGIAATDTTWQGRIYSGAGHVHSRAKAQPNPLAFDTALRTLAAELDEPDTPLINYRQRRGALQTWAIDDDTWEGIVSRLPPIPGPQRPELGDRKRQIASIYVWVRITSGEHLFAPRPIEDAQPARVQEAWKLRRNTIWHLMQSSRPRPHYVGLKAELDALASSLARTIDCDGQR